MRISKYYQQATLYPFLITVVVSFVFFIIDNKDYKSEWLTAEAVIMMCLIYIILYCLMMNVLCLTIFFYKLKVVRNNRLLTFLSWFLLPLLPTIIQLYSEYSYSGTSISQDSHDGIMYIVFANGAFIVGLIWSFINFRKALSSTNKETSPE